MSTDPEPAVPSEDRAAAPGLGTVETSARPGSGDGGPATDRTPGAAASDAVADGAPGAADTSPTPPADGATDSGLVGRVRAVEDLPLADRADAFSALHDELRTRLETGGAGA